MQEKVPYLAASHDIFTNSKDLILSQWLSYKSVQQILNLHNIEAEYFKKKYAGGVFDYFMGVIASEVEIGNCPIMQNLLAYLKNREISADELFEICIHFRRSMVDFSYDAGLNSKELFDEISYIFDENFRGILKYYTDTIFKKLIDARQEAIKASQAKEYFLSNMSHEIRTPLNAILGFVNILITEDLSKKHKKYLNTILNSGENLLGIINDILDFSKLRSGEFTIEPKIFSIHEQMGQTLELFVASAIRKDITLTTFIDPYIPDEIYADGLRIRQIVSNFLSNAIKFTPQYGHVHVEVILKGKKLKISVNDNGIGIKKDEVKDIFTAFVQAQHTQNSDFSGTGLGLSICYQLAKHMNGKVGVESTYGLGSEFYIEVPVKINNAKHPKYNELKELQNYKIAIYSKNSKHSYKENSFLRYLKSFNIDADIINSIQNEYDITVFVEDDISENIRNEMIDSGKKYISIGIKQNEMYERCKNIVYITMPIYCSKIQEAFKELLHPKNPNTTPSSIGIKFKGHILVAEDNEANQELIKILLNKYGLTFDLASNGVEAVRFYKLNDYDLILMDEQMPLMDGNEAVEKILVYEKSMNLKHTPISALTANVIKGARERGLKSGFDSFLGKPIVLKELERVFSKYLQIDTNQNIKQTTDTNKNRIIGLDVQKLKEDLMLNEDELVMLLKLYIKKMKKQIPQLKKAIEARDYKKIALNAHSIKGSSGNFRLEFLQNSASEMETMAKEQNSNYDYETVFENIKNRVEEIKIL